MPPPVTQISPAAREKLISAFLTTPERQAMYDMAKPWMEQLFKDPAFSKAYLSGSFLTKKPVPGDIDIVLTRRLGEPGGYPIKLSQKTLDLLAKSRAQDVPLHAIPLFSPHLRGGPAQKILQTGRKRYGEKHNWIRILGLATALGLPLSQVLSEEAEAAPKIGATPFVIGKKLAREFEGVILPTKELINIYRSHRWKRMYAEKDVHPVVIKPLVKHGVLSKTGRGEYLVTGKEPPKAGAYAVKRHFYSTPGAEEYAQEKAQELGFTPKEIAKGELQAKRWKIKVAEAVSKAPKWLQGLGSTYSELPESIKQVYKDPLHGVEGYKFVKRPLMSRILYKADVSSTINHTTAGEMGLGFHIKAGEEVGQWKGILLGHYEDAPKAWASILRPELGYTGLDVRSILHAADRVDLDNKRRLLGEVKRIAQNDIEQYLLQGRSTADIVTQVIKNLKSYQYVPPNAESILTNQVFNAVEEVAREMSSRGGFEKLLKPTVQLEDYLKGPSQDAFTRLARAAESTGGMLDIKSLQKTPGLASLYSKYSDVLGALSKGTGKISAKDLYAEAGRAPVGNFFVTTTFWEYKAQSLARVPHDVYQINLNPSGLMQKEKLAQFYLQAKIPEMGHPNLKNAITVGWFRVDKSSTPNTWIIEEVQSDLISFMRRGEKAAERQFVAPETYKALEKWTEAGLTKILADARTEGVDRVIMHTPESLKMRGGASFGERKLHELYIDLAKKFGFQTGELKASEIQHLQREFETLPIYLRVPSIIATVGGAAALGLGVLQPEEAEAARIPTKGLIPVHPKPKGGLTTLRKQYPDLSSAHPDLVGKLVRNKLVREVRGGAGDHRIIIFEDGSHMLLDKKHLATTMAELGRMENVKAFERGRPVSSTIHRIMAELPKAKKAGFRATEKQYVKAMGGPEGVRDLIAGRGLRAAMARKKLPTELLTEKGWAQDIMERIQRIDPALLNKLAIVKVRNRYHIISQTYADHLVKKYPNEVKIVGTRPLTKAETTPRKER